MAKKFPHSFEVCACRSVSLGEIVNAINVENANTIEEIGNLTDAGTCCKCCISSEDDIGEVKMELYLEQILDKFKDKK
ncbi:(2Fe-2S)-binding protein [Poseidonibacter sp.]|uniref:(2Fe-2S)-binding protein n=1 Tax=Poseidonibacter sp. TaxID=2321188 RepID=UPI003C7902D0